MSRPGGASIVRRLGELSGALRAEGVECGPGRLQDALRALEAVDVTDREDAYWALRCTLISRHEEIEVFDAAFAAFCRPEEEPAAEGREREPAPEGRSPADAEPPEAERVGAEDEDEEERPRDDFERGMAWSAVERLRHLDFASYAPEELRALRRLADRVAQAAPRRRSRRLEPAPDGRILDRRRTLRNAIRTGGDPIERSWRRRRLKPRRLVFLVDVSGSMEPYARATITFLQAAVGPGRKVEAFTFGTRLTRVTGQLEGRDPDRALRAATEAVPDWAGGTRIGDAVRAFNRDWGRRGISRGATVVIASDGWERGDTELLAGEMQRLQRAAHSVVWVNPLAAEPGYQPLAQGMAAALPHVDVFLPGHDLEDLETLADVLESLPLRRPTTRPVGGADDRRPRAAP